MDQSSVDARFEQCVMGWRNIVQRALAEGSRWFFIERHNLPTVLAAGTEEECRARCPVATMLSLTEPLHLELAERLIRDSVEAAESLRLAREASPLPGFGGST